MNTTTSELGQLGTYPGRYWFGSITVINKNQALVIYGNSGVLVGTSNDEPDFYCPQGAEISANRSGKYSELDAPLDHINLHIRGGHVIPIQGPANNTAFRCATGRFINPFTPKLKNTFSQPFKEKCIIEVVRIGTLIICVI